MMTATRKTSVRGKSKSFQPVLPADYISDPGCYVCNWSGHLLRVPNHSGAHGGVALASIVGSKPMFVTKLSDDPYIPISEARMLASDLKAVDFGSAPKRSKTKSKPARKKVTKKKTAKRKVTKRSARYGKKAAKKRTTRKSAPRKKTSAKRSAGKKKSRR